MNFAKRRVCRACGVGRDIESIQDETSDASTRIHVSRVLELCPGLVPEGDKHYTDHPDRTWLFDPDSLYWFNKITKAYYRQVEEDETILRRVDKHGRFTDSKNVPLPARTLPIWVHEADTAGLTLEAAPRSKQHAVGTNQTPASIDGDVIVINPSECTTCNVCDRKFDSSEALLRHENLSQLHKDNLRKYRPR